MLIRIEIWVGATFFWKMADILSKGIISPCNDLFFGSFRKGGAANFASNVHHLPETCCADPDFFERSTVFLFPVLYSDVSAAFNFFDFCKNFKRKIYVENELPHNSEETLLLSTTSFKINNKHPLLSF